MLLYAELCVKLRERIENILESQNDIREKRKTTSKSDLPSHSTFPPFTSITEWHSTQMVLRWFPLLLWFLPLLQLVEIVRATSKWWHFTLSLWYVLWLVTLSGIATCEERRRRIVNWQEESRRKLIGFESDAVATATSMTFACNFVSLLLLCVFLCDASLPHQFVNHYCLCYFTPSYVLNWGKDWKYFWESKRQSWKKENDV